MTSLNRPKRILRFGVFEVDLQAGELHKNGLKVKVREQPFQVLTVLLEHPGEVEVVTREELRQRLWPEDTFVDFERSLNVAVSKLREALGDAAENPRFVETLPKRGYRFIAPVERIGEKVAEPEPPPAPVPGRRRLPWLVAAAVALAIGAGVGGWLLFFRPAPQAEMRMVRFTTALGVEKYPAISPDGKQVAFCVKGNIYVKQVGSETPVQRTDNPASDFSPAWSPDGRQIAFCRKPPGYKPGFTILVTDALGGPERTLYKSAAGPGEFLWRQFRRLTWSPNGEFLAFVGGAPPEEPESIF
jgi:DNA-binding winged helix-turn-helix (wHTH) protein